MVASNEAQVGPGQLRDEFLLESAVERPQATFDGVDMYPTIHTKAAALIQSLVVTLVKPCVVHCSVAGLGSTRSMA